MSALSPTSIIYEHVLFLENELHATKVSWHGLDTALSSVPKTRFLHWTSHASSGEISKPTSVILCKS